jgi:hypothetical protein
MAEQDRQIRKILQNRGRCLVWEKPINDDIFFPFYIRCYIMVYSCWLFRFEHSCVAYDKEAAKYAVAYSQLDKFQADRTPRYLQYVLIQDHPPNNLVIKYGIFGVLAIMEELSDCWAIMVIYLIG